MAEVVTKLEVPIRYGWFLSSVRELDEFVHGGVPGENHPDGGTIYTAGRGPNCSIPTQEAWACFYRLAMSDIANKAFPEQ